MYIYIYMCIYVHIYTFVDITSLPRSLFVLGTSQKSSCLYEPSKSQKVFPG